MTPSLFLQPFADANVIDDLRLVTASPRLFRKRDCLVRQGEDVPALSILIEGVAYACRTLLNGAQQTLALFVPGDVLDAKGYVVGWSSVSICALSDVRVIQIDRHRLDALTEVRPALSRWLLGVMASEKAVLEEWAIGLGRRLAYQQLAHMLCEFEARMRAAGLASDVDCAFPLVQSDLADVLGLSSVHVNRILQQLRTDDLIKLQRGRLKILDHARLFKVSDFDPKYLEPRPMRAGSPQPSPNTTPTKRAPLGEGRSAVRRDHPDTAALTPL